MMFYDDLKEYGSEAAVKSAGKLRQVGKDYESKQICLQFFLNRITNPSFISGWWWNRLLEGWPIEYHLMADDDEGM